MKTSPVVSGGLLLVLGFSLGIALAPAQPTEEGRRFEPLYDQVLVGLEHEAGLLAYPIEELLGLEKRMEDGATKPRHVASFSRLFMPPGLPSGERQIPDYAEYFIARLNDPINQELNEEALERKVLYVNYALIRAYQQNQGYLERLEASLQTAEAYPPGSGIPITDLMEKEPYRTWLRALDTTDLNPAGLP